MQLYLIYSSAHYSGETKLLSQWPLKLCLLLPSLADFLCEHKKLCTSTGPSTLVASCEWGLSPRNMEDSGAGGVSFGNVWTLAFQTVLFLNHTGP